MTEEGCGVPLAPSGTLICKLFALGASRWWCGLIPDLGVLRFDEGPHHAAAVFEGVDLIGKRLEDNELVRNDTSGAILSPLRVGKSQRHSLGAGTKGFR